MNALDLSLLINQLPPNTEVRVASMDPEVDLDELLLGEALITYDEEGHIYDVKVGP